MDEATNPAGLNSPLTPAGRIHRFRLDIICPLPTASVYHLGDSFASRLPITIDTVHIRWLVVPFRAAPVWKLAAHPDRRTGEVSKSSPRPAS